MSATTDRLSYQRLYDTMLTPVVQCICGRSLDARVGFVGLTRAGWTFDLGISRLRWRCEECSR